MNIDRRCWAEVDLDALKENVGLLRGRLGDGCRMMAVLKGGAYGHGDRWLVPFIEEMDVDWLGVATLEEGVRLREGGATRPILILGYTPAHRAPELIRLGLTQTVFSRAYAEALAAHVEEGRQADVHLKVDSGMHRLGLHPGAPESLGEAVAVYGNPRLRCTGIFTHFAVADETEEASRRHTHDQFRLFTEFLRKLEEQGIRPGIRHCCNSAATLCFPEMHLDMVRCGIATYGLSPSVQLAGVAPLKPVMSLYTRIAQLRVIESGEGVGYGREFVALGSRVVATIPIGYADGYGRSLGGRATALVGGVRVPVIGRVCMDQAMLDVTEVPGVREGDRVTLVGRDGGEVVSFDDLADLTGTISYERVAAISLRVPRFYLREGRVVSSSEDPS